MLLWLWRFSSLYASFPVITIPVDFPLTFAYNPPMRQLATIILLACIVAMPRPAYAEDASCNQWERVQSVILSEATSQPFEAQLEIARVVVTKGACFLDSDFYAGYGIAERIALSNPRGCISNTHCRAYFLLHTIDPAIRESSALAAHYALTESPRISRYHFDRFDSTAYWWNSLRACPNGWFIVGETKVC